MEFKPLGMNVVIDYEQVDEEKTKGGIIMSNNARPQEGIVVAVGPGPRNPRNGIRGEMTVKVGDKVKFKAWAGKEVKIEGKEYFIMPELDIEGILLDEEEKQKK